MAPATTLFSTGVDRRIPIPFQRRAGSALNAGDRSAGRRAALAEPSLPLAAMLGTQLAHTSP